MKPILSYYLEANVYLLLFLAFYWVFLRQETQFQFNRIYLLLALVTSLVFPIISLEDRSGTAMMKSLGNSIRVYWLPEVVVSTGEEAASFWAWMNLPDAWGAMKLVYFTGVSIAGLVFMVRFVALLKIIYQANSYKWNGCLVAESAEESQTFSFFNFIFIGKSTALTPQEREEILRHERIHVVQLHSMDVLLSQLIGILFWFNPLVRTYHKLFVQLHEFEADARAVENRDANEYCQLLARVALQSAGVPLANHFNHSLTVKRIFMMQTVKKKIRAWKIAGLIVLFPTAFLIVSCQKQAPEEVQKQASEEVQKEGPELVDADPVASEKLGQEQVYTVVEKMPEFPGGTEALMRFLGKNIISPKSRGQGIDGSIYVQFEIDSSGRVINPTIVKGLSAECDKEALRIVSLMPAWEPGMQNGKKVRVKYVLPFRFRTDDEPTSIIESQRVAPIQGKLAASFTKVKANGKVSIQGTVLDDQQKPLSGVAVVLVGTNTGTITDKNGTFSLQVNDESGELAVSYVGGDSKLYESKRLHF